MLLIDYSIIPLTDEDRLAIRKTVRERIEAGQLPVVQKNHYGRAAVVNPDAVQTVHHIPDELRTPLRRALHAANEGALPLSAERVYKGLIEGEGPLYFTIIELESPFKHMQEFLDYLPRLNARYPDMAVFLVGALPLVVETLQGAMAKPGTKLKLHYSDGRGLVEINDPAELDQVQSEQKEAPSFSLPFFSQIRLALAEGQKPIAFNLDSMRRLHAHFGTGEAKEIDMGGGRVEKVVVIDLPTRLIKDFQFRQDRGLDFHGVIRNGQTILSRNFEKEKLEFRWVPLDSLEALLRRVPGKDVEVIPLKNMKALRINTFNGSISFIARASKDQISIEQAESVTIERPAPAGAPNAGKPHQIRFDALIIGKGGTHFDRLQDAVKLHYYGRLMSGEEEQRIKLERYTRRLTVGSVGPLAGHTLKLLRRYGLERLIDTSGFHYLCDTAAQLPEHHLAAQRFEETFQSLLKMLRDIASVAGNTKIRLDDITHKTPVMTEWLDIESVRLEDITSTDLETAHREIRTLIGFIDHEFQRQFEIGTEDLTFFKKIEACQAASLLAKWLADYKRGAYGTPLPEGAHPDLLFLATGKDRTANDQRYFLPALVCSDFFTDPGNRALFDRGDYHFPVFLESHLALAEHEVREGGESVPSLAAVEKYFDAQTEKLDGRLRDLEASSGHIDMSGSPEYQALVKQEEEAYHQRYGQFLQEKEQVVKRLSEAEHAFQEILVEVAPRLKLPTQPDKGWLSGSEPDSKAFSTEFLQAARTALHEMQARAGQMIGAIGKQLAERAAALKAYTAHLAAMQQAHWRWQTTETAAGFGNLIAQVDQSLPGRMAALKKQDEKTRETYQERIVSQTASADSELQQAQAAEELRRNRSAQAVRAMQASVERLAAQCAGLAGAAIPRPEKLKSELARAAGAAKRVLELAQSLGANATKLTEDLTRHGQALIQIRQTSVQVHKLRTEVAALKAIATNAEPERVDAPKPAFLAAGGDGAARESLHAAYQEQQGQLEGWAKKLEVLAQPPAELKQGQELLETFQHLRERVIQMEKLISHKDRLRRSVAAIDERIKIMDRELADLPKRVEMQFMPARKELLINIFIPEAQRELDYARQAKSFVRELNNLDMQAIKDLYLDRAVFRRFSSRQFVHGAQISVDLSQPAARGLHNVQPALNRFVQQVEYNFRKTHPDWCEKTKLEFAKPMEPSLIWSFIQQMHGMGDKPRFNYVVLPGTLPVDQAVRMMIQKDQLYNGLPMLVLIYLSKFDDGLLHGDNAFRESYFKAVKHNVVLNIDNRVLVDNPVAIAERLAQETLGSAWDHDKLDALPADEGIQAVKSRA